MMHGLAYPSGRSITKRMEQKFIWHATRGNTRHWVRACISCQASKVTKYTSGIGLFLQPFHRLAHIHVSIIRLLPNGQDTSPSPSTGQQNSSRQLPWPRRGKILCRSFPLGGDRQILHARACHIGLRLNRKPRKENDKRNYRPNKFIGSSDSQLLDIS